MKTAVIYGVAQMTMGSVLKCFNYIYLKKPVDLIFEGFTQVIMILCLFGFMDMLIIGKWLFDWEANKGYRAPGIIKCMINMFLAQGHYTQPKSGKPYPDLIPNQTANMQICLVIALLCVPLMLLVKPCYYNALNKKNDVGDNYEGIQGSGSDNDIKKLLDVGGPSDEKKETFGDLFIHSMIETIEYALGTVSNTASYLRLWALSLAHG